MHVICTLPLPRSNVSQVHTTFATLRTKRRVWVVLDPRQQACSRYGMQYVVLSLNTTTLAGIVLYTSFPPSTPCTSCVHIIFVVPAPNVITQGVGGACPETASTLSSLLLVPRRPRPPDARCRLPATGERRGCVDLGVGQA